MHLFIIFLTGNHFSRFTIPNIHKHQFQNELDTSQQRQAVFNYLWVRLNLALSLFLEPSEDVSRLNHRIRITTKPQPDVQLLLCFTLYLCICLCALLLLSVSSSCSFTCKK